MSIVSKLTIGLLASACMVMLSAQEIISIGNQPVRRISLPCLIPSICC